LKFPFPVRPLDKIGGLFLCLLSVYANKELYLLCFSHGHMIFSHLFSDLEKLGGLIPLIQELNNADEGIRTTSAWVLGKASQNNVLVQNQILGYGALKRLVNMGYSSSAAEAAKALYAISSLIRDNEHGQELFLSENGYAMLQHILSTDGNNVRLQKKVVSLLAYVADFQLSRGKSQASLLSNHLFIKSVVDMISAPDIDLQEKVPFKMASM